MHIRHVSHATLFLIILEFLTGLAEHSRVLADVPTAKDIEVNRDVNAIEFEGHLAFPADQLRQALTDDPEFQLAAHPACSAESFLELLEQRLRAGYQHGGYPHPQIIIRRIEQSSRVAVEIDAGSRFQAGRVEINGSTGLSAQAIENWLTKPRPRSDASPVSVTIGGQQVTRWINSSGSPSVFNKVLWKANDPASFDPADHEHWNKEISRCCATHGFFDVRFQLLVRPETDGTATLVVKIDDEGHQAHLESVTVEGLKRNRPAELQEYLGLTEGMPITATLQPELLRKLIESGKYLEHKVKLNKTGESKVSLHISVIENKLATPLNQPRTDAEEAACRLAAWLNQLVDAQEDLVVESVVNPDLRMIWSVREQLLFAEFARRVTPDGPVYYGVAGLADSSGIAISAIHRQQQFVLPRVDGQIIIQVIGSTRRPNRQGKTSRLMIGAGVHTVVADQMPVSAIISIAPAMTINEFLKEGSAVTSHDGLMTCKGPNFQIVTELKTGRLIEFVCESEQFGPIRVSPDNRRLKTAIETHRERVKNFSSVFDKQQPCTSLLQFGLNLIDPVSWFDDDGDDSTDQTDEVADAEMPANRKLFDERDTIADAEALETFWLEVERVERGIDVARKLLKPQTLGPLDQFAASLLNRWFDKTENRFELPAHNNSTAHIGLRQAERTAYALLNHDGWAYRVTRDWNLAVNNWKRPEVKTIQAAFVTDAESESLGPIGALYTTYIGSMLQYPQTREIAAAALEQLSKENVQRDIRQLLSPDSPLGQIAAGLFTSIAACSSDEWEDFVVTMLPPEIRFVAVRLQAVCELNQNEPDRNVPEMIDSLYPDLIEPWLRSYFESFAVPRPGNNPD